MVHVTEDYEVAICEKINPIASKCQNDTDKKGYGWSGRGSLVLAQAPKLPFMKATSSPNPVTLFQTLFPFNPL